MAPTSYTAEIFLTKKYITPEEWRSLFSALSSLQPPFSTWQIAVTLKNHRIHYYIKTTHMLPSTLNDLGSFLFKSAVWPTIPQVNHKITPLFKAAGNLSDLANYGQTRGYGQLEYVEISFRKLFFDSFFATTYLSFNRNYGSNLYKAYTAFPAQLLSIDFSANKSYVYKSPPKYTETNKILEFLSYDQNQALLAIDAFPYFTDKHFIKLQDYDFAKHSLILGSSGSGKSKFLSSFVNNIHQNPDLRKKHKVIIIDPHAAIIKDLQNIGHNIDFITQNSSIDLFASNDQDANSATELLLDLFKTLLADQYNPRLERVLRHSIYILLTDQILNFSNLRKLLLELNFRNLIVKKLTPKLPFSIVNFFLTDFNELKTKSYTEAIAPIISFLDEMEMLPVFSSTKFTNNLESTIQNNFLTIFSLDRTKIGTKVTQTISGLIMEQLLTLIERNNYSEQIILIVDEVAVIENPILSRLLSEARKYNLSLILVGQFFNQFSATLQNSILANVINYYIFRISRIEATMLADNLSFNVPANDTRECKIKLLTELNNRELITRISINGKLLPAFKSTTMDFVAP